MGLPAIMTIEEVAEYLRVSERTVYDWASKGEIPCGKIGSAWRFKSSDIEAWVNKQLNTDSHKKGDFVPLFLNKALSRENVLVQEKAGKAEVLNALIDMLAETSVVNSKKDLSNGIFHREQLLSTGIGMGIGIPHVRLNSIKDVAVAAALVREGVKDYESLDSEPVKLIFMIVARQDQHAEHLKLLSQLSSRLKDKEFREKLTRCSDSRTFYDFLMESR
ncbi:MAG: fructose PTS transporter subunit IIA [Victivallaceae bacterium]|nr:fructose PTS transporter subunit IIA [Victivallaceae bacterium]